LFGGSSFPDYEDLRQQTSAFTDLAAYDSASLNLTGAETRRDSGSSLVTTNYFKVLGVGAHLGRTLREEDDVSGAPADCRTSYAFWQRHFGGDRSVVGRSLILGNKAYTIVGSHRKVFVDCGWIST
jgi:hypothetical protein